MAAVKMSSEILGIPQLLKEWGHEADGVVMVDSAAALGVVGRRGNGKLRNIRVGMLWRQEKAEDGSLIYSKVLGTENPADLMTKSLCEKIVIKLMDTIAQKFRGGRGETALIT